MQINEQPGLANAANVLSDQLRSQLESLARVVAPHAASLEKKYLRRLSELRFGSREARMLAQLTFGNAARSLAAGEPPKVFFDQVASAGKRLAQSNLPPADVVRALSEYEPLLDRNLAKLSAEERKDADWVRDQLHFCVVLALNNTYYEVREAETLAFQQVLGIELETREPSELYRRFISAMADMCHADAGALYLLERKLGQLFLKGATAENGHAVDPIRFSAGLRRRFSHPLYIAAGRYKDAVLDRAWGKQHASVWSFPFVRAGEFAGVMQFGFREEREWLPREQEMLAAASERCLMVADRARLISDLAGRQRQLKDLAEHMLDVEEMERRRISRELHDEAGQSLVCIRLSLEMTEGDIPEELAEVRGRLKEVRDLTEKTILDIRRLIADLSPAVLEQLGLGAAVRQLINRFRKSYPCQVRLHVGKVPDVPQKVQIVTYRLLQECCNNIAKHSGATNVNISVTCADGVLKLSVADNGAGFEMEEALAKHKSFGLAGMRERVALLGGRFEICSQRAGRRRGSRGTRIEIELPLPGEENSTLAP